MKTLLARVTSNRPLFIKLLVASFLVNILALATPIYVIQVLQRYVAYGVTSTLVTLILGVTFIVIFEFFFRNIRHRMAREYELKNVEIANMVLTKLNNIKSHIYEVSFKLRNDLINKNLNIIQNVFSASTILIILDVPFTIIFLIALFLIHYQIGLICLFFNCCLIAASLNGKSLPASLKISVSFFSCESVFTSRQRISSLNSFIFNLRCAFSR